jgi:iron-sulfur cluster assembly protein
MNEKPRSQRDRRGDVLALTEDAVSAVNTILTNAELPEGSGMRISRAPSSENSAGQELELRLSVVDAPAEGDQVIGEQPVFVEPEAVEALDDKLLDAEIVEDQVRFTVGQQA